MESVLTLCRRGNRLAAGVLVIVTTTCVTGFLLGYAALSDGMRTVWIVFGGVFAIIAIGSLIAAMLGLRTVTGTASDLVIEIQAMLDGGTVQERTVVETVEATDASQDESAVVLSRQFFTLQDEVGRSERGFPSVTAALAAITRFPAYLLVSTMITLVFGVLGLLFLIGLAL